METENSYSKLRNLAKSTWQEFESVDATAVDEVATAIRKKRLTGVAVHFAAWVLIHEQMRGSRGLRARHHRAGSTSSDIATTTDELEEDVDSVVRLRVGAWPPPPPGPLRPVHGAPVRTGRRLVVPRTGRPVASHHFGRGRAARPRVERGHPRAMPPRGIPDSGAGRGGALDDRGVGGAGVEGRETLLSANRQDDVAL